MQCTALDRVKNHLSVRASYLHNGARQTHGHNEPPIGSGPLQVKWSGD